MNDLKDHYQITRSKRKTLAIHIKNGQVEIRAPMEANKIWIDEFVEKKSTWIKKQITLQKQQEQEIFSLTHGEKIPILGEYKTIQCIPNMFEQVLLDENTISLFCNDTQTQNLNKIFHEWLKQFAKNYITPRVYEIAKHLNISEKINEIKFRKTKTKWGHCSADGKLQFNWLIMHAPEAVINYLIIHEICHLIHFNHSKKFWAIVESLDPKYLQSERWLKQNQHKFR